MFGIYFLDQVELAWAMEQQPSVLASWKEIASYLGKGVRTVQRWEAQFGLPVRRPSDRTNGVVLASREDLDRWLAVSWNQRNANVGIEKSRELRNAQRRLVADLRRCADELNEQCQAIATRLTEGSDGSDGASSSTHHTFSWRQSQ
jgi:hypothetical protein